MARYSSAPLDVFREFKNQIEKLFVKVADYSQLTIKKQEEAEKGYAATYKLMKGSEAIGEPINIPLDYLVKSAQIETCSEDGVPTGCVSGEKYIDFIIYVKEGAGTAEHLYLPLKDLGGTFTAEDRAALEKLKSELNNAISNAEEAASTVAKYEDRLNTLETAGYIKSTDIGEITEEDIRGLFTL